TQAYPVAAAAHVSWREPKRLPQPFRQHHQGDRSPRPEHVVTLPDGGGRWREFLRGMWIAAAARLREVYLTVKLPPSFAMRVAQLSAPSSTASTKSGARNAARMTLLIRTIAISCSIGLVLLSPDSCAS